MEGVKKSSQVFGVKYKNVEFKTKCLKVCYCQISKHCKPPLRHSWVKLTGNCEKGGLGTWSLALPESGILDEVRIMHFLLNMIDFNTKISCEKMSRKRVFKKVFTF